MFVGERFATSRVSPGRRADGKGICALIGFEIGNAAGLFERSLADSLEGTKMASADPGLAVGQDG
jgi:hypothetical protein